jgi:glucuronoarabinoxylan endo-1,4-beta-xylanase
MVVINKIQLSLFVLVFFSVKLVFPESVTIDWNNVRQEIDGYGCFGGYGAADQMSDETIDLLCDTNTGCGFSILRWEYPMWDALWETDPNTPLNGDWPYGYKEPWVAMHKAIEKGCKRHLLTAWSCQGWMKDNNKIGGGGHLKPECYQAYADTVAKLYDYYIEEGFDPEYLYFSPTNEPNLVMSYASMQWTQGELLIFVRDYLGPALESRGVNILLGEEERWADDIVDSLLDDEVARGYTDVVAGHGYWWNRDGNADPGEPFPFTKSQSFGIHTWQTEICNTAPGCPTDMTNGLMWGSILHRYMVNAETNGWIWWFGHTPVADDEEALRCVGNGEWRKLTWVIGQYSKFVRPGFYRIATDAPKEDVDVLISAYKEERTGNWAVVVLNLGGGTTLDVTFDGCEISGEVTPYATTDAANIQEGSSISPSSSGFSASIAGLSATTFVGHGPAETAIKKSVSDKKSILPSKSFQISGRMLTLSEDLAGKSCSIAIHAMNGSLLRRINVSSQENTGRIPLPETGAGAIVVQLKTQDGISVRKMISR